MKHIPHILSSLEVEGWLLFDFHGSNPFVKELLSISPETLLTRRFFYWIPQKGTPVAILHHIESEVASHLDGEKRFYRSWQELEEVLKDVLRGVKKVAMEYSPRNANPYLSKVDAGTFELISSFGITIVSSAPLLQQFTSLLDEKQEKSHQEAAVILEGTVEKTWEWIASHLKRGASLTEYDVQRFILNEFASHSCETEGSPICAVNAHSANPHYVAQKEGAKEIKKGDFILLDLWCKKKSAHAVFADITRVGVASAQASPKHMEIFTIVREAQKRALDFVKEKIEGGFFLTGAEVDDVCREYIKSRGYGDFFTHRTGHSIYTRVHGDGAHLDNFEIADRRQLLPSTCFSVEPGIYLPGEFGVRLECDVWIDVLSRVHVTGGTQDAIKLLL